MRWCLLWAATAPASVGCSAALLLLALRSCSAFLAGRRAPTTERCDGCPSDCSCRRFNTPPAASAVAWRCCNSSTAMQRGWPTCRVHREVYTACSTRRPQASVLTTLVCRRVHMAHTATRWAHVQGCSSSSSNGTPRLPRTPVQANTGRCCILKERALQSSLPYLPYLAPRGSQ